METLYQSLTISSEILAQEVDGETVLLDLNSERYFGLDEIGTRIWQLLQEHDDTQKILQCMFDEYDVEEPQLIKDVNDLICQLDKAGIVTVKLESDD